MAGHHDPRIDEIAASLRLLAYRLNCANEAELEDARRIMIAAIRSELESAVRAVKVVEAAADNERA